VAKALGAAKLIYITTMDGLIYQGRLIQQILVADLDGLLAHNKSSFAPEVFSKAHYASAACQAGVPRVHVINGRVDEALLTEVFSNEGIGTLVYANEYQQIRRALKKDIRAILLLTKNSVASEELIKRTRAGVEKSINDFYIFETDKNPVACVALHQLDRPKGELACLYVSPSHENQGIGRKLIAFAESKARELGHDRVDHAFDAGLHLFSVQGRFQRRHSGRPAARPPRKIRAERAQLENPHQEAGAQMTRVPKALAAAFRACARCGVAPTRHVLAVNIARQTTALFQRQQGGYALRKTFRCSTSKFGIGESAGSNMTPRGLHRVAKKIGGGWPIGAVFQGPASDRLHLAGAAPWRRIAHRILWLEGLEPGFNRGGKCRFLSALHLHSRHRQRNDPGPARFARLHPSLRRRSAALVRQAAGRDAGMDRHLTTRQTELYWNDNAPGRLNYL
jgi:N-acetylglutamate synthase-like GNAT family acetyltransferase